MTNKSYVLEVFCFGSNLSGWHGAGAAKFAKENHNAEYGIGYGWTSDTSFAIPTKDEKLYTMSPDRIKMHVDYFIDQAKIHPNYKFMVTAIGTGLAGISVDKMAIMFAHVPDNVYLPKLFLDYLYGENNWNKEIMSYDW